MTISAASAIPAFAPIEREPCFEVKALMEVVVLVGVLLALEEVDVVVGDMVRWMVGDLSIC